MALLTAFNPHELSEATVRAVATGRERIVEEILGTIRGNLGAATIQHLIVSAPRGYGKSFLMRHLQIEVERMAREKDLPLAVVLMPEEMPHVREPETLIRELTRGLTGGAGVAAELTWHEDDNAAWDSSLEALVAAIRERVGPQGLVVALVENFDLLLRRAFPRESQSARLRSVLAAPGGQLMLIAASASGAFDRDYDLPLFQAFREVPLEPWSVEDCLAFFDRQRADAGKPPLDDQARARAKAVAQYIGGTPRLATLVGDALLEEDVLRAADLLQHLVDELTPYYKERIEALPGRAQKLLDALLRGGEPATQSTIAQRVKASAQSAIAGPFNELVKERMVVGQKAPDSAEVLYRVADRVLAHYYRRRVIAHGETRCSLEALVDLLAEYFSPQQKEAKAAEFLRVGRVEEARLMARLHDADRGTTKAARRWMLYSVGSHYIPKRLVPLASDAVAAELQAVAEDLRRGDVDRAYARIKAAREAASRPEDQVVLLSARSYLDTYEGIEGGLAAAEEAVAIAKGVADPRFLLLAEREWARSLSHLGRDAESLEMSIRLAERARAVGLAVEEAVALCSAAFELANLGCYREGLETGRKAAALAHEAGDRQEEAMALRNISLNLGGVGRYVEAIETARDAADLAREAGDLREEAAALLITAFSLGELGRHAEAVSTGPKAALLAHKTGDLKTEALALRLTAFSLGMLGRHAKAVETGQNAAKLAHEAGDLGGEASALRHTAFSLGGLGRHAEAVETGQKAATLAHEASVPIVEVDAMRLVAESFAAMDLYEKAIGALAGAAEILDTISDENKRRLWQRTTRSVAQQAAMALAGRGVGLEALHALLALSAEKLDIEGQRRDCLGLWMREFVSGAIRGIDDPDRLESWAAAIALHFPGAFREESDQLRAAAWYHRSGRDRVILARLDPDLGRALSIVFPPPKGPGAEADSASDLDGPKRPKSRRRKS